MDVRALLFWKSGPAVKLTAAEIARELMWGEEVEGLIDQPIRAILDKLKAEFPQHEEKSGTLIGRGAVGHFEATWTWQFVRIDDHGLLPAEHERLIDAIESFDCMAYDHQTSKLP